MSVVGLFQVLKGKPDGTFKAATTLLGIDGEPLIIPIESREEMTKNICTRPTAVDWDGDGDLDLVVGNFEGSFYVFNGKGKGEFFPKPEPILVGDSVTLASRAEGVGEQGFAEKYADWQKEFDVAMKEYSSAKEPEEQRQALERYQKVYGQRSKLISEERTGFVWLYVQK